MENPSNWNNYNLDNPDTSSNTSEIKPEIKVENQEKKVEKQEKKEKPPEQQFPKTEKSSRWDMIGESLKKEKEIYQKEFAKLTPEEQQKKINELSNEINEQKIREKELNEKLKTTIESDEASDRLDSSKQEEIRNDIRRIKNYISALTLELDAYKEYILNKSTTNTNKTNQPETEPEKQPEQPPEKPLKEQPPEQPPKQTSKQPPEQIPTAKSEQLSPEEQQKNKEEVEKIKQEIDKKIQNLDKKRKKLDEKYEKLNKESYLSPKDKKRMGKIVKEHEELSTQVKDLEKQREQILNQTQVQPQPEKQLSPKEQQKNKEEVEEIKREITVHFQEVLQKIQELPDEKKLQLFVAVLEEALAEAYKATQTPDYKNQTGKIKQGINKIGTAKEQLPSAEQKIVDQAKKSKKESLKELIGGAGGALGMGLLMFIILAIIGEFKLLEKSTGLDLGGEGGKSKKK